MSVSQHPPLQFNGWRPDRPGWIFGLTTPSLIALGAVAAWPLMGFWLQRYWMALAGVVFWGLVAVATVWRPLGRPSSAWAFAWLLWKWADVRGLNVFQSRLMSEGVVMDMNEPDLPGQLQRLVFHDGPSIPGHGPLGLIYDPAQRTWTFVARVTPRGLGLSTPEEKAALVAGRADLLATLGASGGYIRQMVELVRTLPDDGATAFEWQTRNWNPDAPLAARQAVGELMELHATTGVRTESFLVIQLDEDRAKRAADAAGGGAAGYGRVAARTAGVMGASIGAAGCDDVAWMSGQDIVRATKDGLSPLDAGSREQARVAARSAGLPEPRGSWALAGPGMAVNEWGVYLHGGMATVTFAIALHPERNLPLDALGALMATTVTGEQRSIAVYHQPKSAREADRAVAGEQYQRDAVIEGKRKRSFRVSIKERKAYARAERAEMEISAGHTLERAAINLSVSVPVGEALDDAVESAIATARRFGMSPERMWGSQDSGFFATALPFGMGLPPVRKLSS